MLTDAQMQKLGVEELDTAEYLKSDEACEAYLNEMLKSENAELIVYALGVVARAKGIIAKKPDAVEQVFTKRFQKMQIRNLKPSTKFLKK